MTYKHIQRDGIYQALVFYHLIFSSNIYFQAKDLHLSLILICVICVFVITNFPRLLLNLYEMFHCDAIIACGDRFFPPAWFICSTAFNHLLLVVNCVMNFVVYCYFNNSFRYVISTKSFKLFN